MPKSKLLPLVTEQILSASASEVLRATLDLIGANEAAARAESELVVVRIQAEGERTAAIRARPTWQRSVPVAGGGD